MIAKPIFMRALQLLALLSLAAVVSGCAHPLSMTGNVAALTGTGKLKIEKAVGLAISEEDRKREVTTPGGGGDKLSYFPFRDLETGLYIALSESFSKVVRIAGISDPKVKAEGLSYIITPQITTTSFSASMVTWPPTIFTIELNCKVVNTDGNVITEVRVAGEGRAEFDEFKKENSLAAMRAADDALSKLVKALGEASAKLR
jgi:hypothetical protein